MDLAFNSASKRSRESALAPSESTPPRRPSALAVEKRHFAEEVTLRERGDVMAVAAFERHSALIARGARKRFRRRYRARTDAAPGAARSPQRTAEVAMVFRIDSFEDLDFAQRQRLLVFRRGPPASSRMRSSIHSSAPSRVTKIRVLSRLLTRPRRHVCAMSCRVGSSRACRWKEARRLVLETLAHLFERDRRCKSTLHAAQIEEHVAAGGEVVLHSENIDRCAEEEFACSCTTTPPPPCCSRSSARRRTPARLECAPRRSTFSRLTSRVSARG